MNWSSAWMLSNLNHFDVDTFLQFSSCGHVSPYHKWLSHSVSVLILHTLKRLPANKFVSIVISNMTGAILVHSLFSVSFNQAHSPGYADIQDDFFVWLPVVFLKFYVPLISFSIYTNTIRILLHRLTFMIWHTQKLLEREATLSTDSAVIGATTSSAGCASHIDSSLHSDWIDLR